MVCKIFSYFEFPKRILLRASMVVTYYIKPFRTGGADKHNGILMSLLLLVAETKNKKLTPFGKFAEAATRRVLQKTCS